MEKVRRQWMYPLLLLLALQPRCYSGADVDPLGKCGPRDLTPECCLKEHPGQWERCTGVSEMARGYSPAVKAAAVGTLAAVAAGPVTLPAERRGVELAVDLRAKVERALEKCTRQADQDINDRLFDGRSPSKQLCEQIKINQQPWSAYLGLLKHEEAWSCLREALDKLLPGRYLLHPRFYFNPQSGKWEYMEPDLESQIVHREGWKGLKGTLVPDIVLLDLNGIILLVYDMKFPCPESNGASWDFYRDGPWLGRNQGQVYSKVLDVPVQLVSPLEGVVQDYNYRE